MASHPFQTEEQRKATFEAAGVTPTIPKTSVSDATSIPNVAGTQFNFRLPDGTLIPATINPGQADTIDVAGVVGGGIAADVPEPILSTAKQQLGITTPEQLQQFQESPEAFRLGRGGTSSLGSFTPAPQGTRGLQQSAELAVLDKRIEDISIKLAAGIRTGGAETILTGLFEKFKIGDEVSLLNAFNAQILDTQQRLRDLPEDVQRTLEDVGVSENQLNRLILKESQKPLETLRDLMELKGVAQDRINQSLKFVSLFADAKMQDKAAKLEALAFELEQAEGKFENLQDDARDFAKAAVEERKDILLFIEDNLKGAPKDVFDAAQGADSIEELQEIAAPFLKQRADIDTAKDVATGIASQIIDMSDAEALAFIQGRASSLGLDVNVLLDAVEGEEAKQQLALDKEKRLAEDDEDTSVDIPTFDEFVDEFIETPKGQELINRLEQQRAQTLSSEERKNLVAEEVRDLFDQTVQQVQASQGEKFTSTEKKKLEQAGLFNATRQEQLDFLFGGTTGFDFDSL